MNAKEKESIIDNKIVELSKIIDAMTLQAEKMLDEAKELKHQIKELININLEDVKNDIT